MSESNTRVPILENIIGVLDDTMDTMNKSEVLRPQKSADPEARGQRRVGQQETTCKLLVVREEVENR